VWCVSIKKEYWPGKRADTKNLIAVASEGAKSFKEGGCGPHGG